MDIVEIILLVALILFVYLMYGVDPIDYDKEEESRMVSHFKDEEEEIFHHPTTGYSGNWDNMRTYIENRERNND